MKERGTKESYGKKGHAHGLGRVCQRRSAETEAAEATVAIQGCRRVDRAVEDSRNLLKWCAAWGSAVREEEGCGAAYGL